MRQSYFPIIIVLLAMMCSCNAVQKDNYETLISTKWQLERVVNQDGGDPVVPIEPVTIEFTDSSTVSGNGGCNVFFGVYSTMGDDEIDIEIKGRSMAMCPSLDMEDKFIAILDLSTSYLAQSNELQINDLESGLTLVFKPTNK